MNQTPLAIVLRRLFTGGSAAGLVLAATPLAAQVTPPPPPPPLEASTAPIQRVEITGSSIRRIASETSLPITTMRAADFAKQGLATAQEVLNAIPMILTQWLSPAPTVDPMQAKMMKAMPFVFSVMLAFAPAGLVLYWSVNGWLSLLQQWVINKRIQAADSKPR